MEICGNRFKLIFLKIIFVHERVLIPHKYNKILTNIIRVQTKNDEMLWDRKK